MLCLKYMHLLQPENTTSIKTITVHVTKISQQYEEPSALYKSDLSIYILGQQETCKVSGQCISVIVTQWPYSSVSRTGGINRNVYTAITQCSSVEQSGSIFPNRTGMKINAQDTIYSTATCGLEILQVKAFRSINYV